MKLSIIITSVTLGSLLTISDSNIQVMIFNVKDLFTYIQDVTFKTNIPPQPQYKYNHSI